MADETQSPVGLQNRSGLFDAVRRVRRRRSLRLFRDLPASSHHSYLVRHAEKVIDPSNSDPDLSPAGQRVPRKSFVYSAILESMRFMRLNTSGPSRP